MDDEVAYSTVVFNRFDDSQPRVAAEAVEEVVYSEIKRNGKGPPPQSSPMPIEEVAASFTPSYRKATAVLGLLCVLLIAGVVVMSAFNTLQVSHYKSILALYTNESTAHKKLQTEMAALEKDKEELTVQIDQFNNTLRSIIQYSTFPVSAFCQIRDGEIHCEPCMKNWIQNGSSCYLFHDGYDWKSWENSRQYCVGMGGDLAIIDNIEEQEFIMQSINFYYDIYHGYWIGLYKNPTVWKWTSGTTLKTGFWIDPPKPSDYNCVMANPNSKDLKSWQPTYCGMRNRWICEMSTMEWPDKL